MEAGKSSTVDLDLCYSLQQPPPFVIPNAAFFGAVLPEGILLDDSCRFFGDFVEDMKVVKSEDDGYCEKIKAARNSSPGSYNGTVAATANVVVKGQWTAEEDRYLIVDHASFCMHACMQSLCSSDDVCTVLFAAC